MPWSITDAMRERILFVGAVQQEKASFRSLCRAFGIAPKTGYKWWNQFQREGADGLLERSRRPHGNSRAIPADVAARVVALREAHPTWGPRKLLAWLEHNEPDWELPAASTVGELLKRRGLVTSAPETPRQRRQPRSAPLVHATRPNSVWSMDFKGWFRLGDRSRCDPLTVTDNYSRYLLCLEGAVADQTSERVWRCLQETFREYGMPKALRFDNGQPWAATKGTLRLTTLSVRLLKLGLQLERIEPGKPHQNGRHERFHLTLQRDTAQPPASTMRAQQRRFDRFRVEYNEQRPHEALRHHTPSTKYSASSRAFPSKLPTPQYPSWCDVHVLDAGGFLYCKGQRYFLTTALKKEPVGVYEVEEGCFEIYFCSAFLGHIHKAHPEIGLLPMSSV